MKFMRIKKEFLNFILSGEKSLEVRVLYPNLKSIKPGDLINMNNQAIIRVKDVRKYPSFKKMLSKENPARILPGSCRKEVLRALKKIYPPAKENLGVLVLEVEPAEQV